MRSCKVDGVLRQNANSLSFPINTEYLSRLNLAGKFFTKTSEYFPEIDMNTTQVQNNHRRNLYDSVPDHAECSVQLMFDFVKKILGIIE